MENFPLRERSNFTSQMTVIPQQNSKSAKTHGKMYNFSTFFKKLVYF